MNFHNAFHALLHAQPLDSCIDPRETVVFFPTAAALCDGRWQIPIHGWIYLPAELSRLRRIAFSLARRMLRFRVPSDHPGMPLFQQRASAFLADNERGNRVKIQLGEASFTLKRSRPNGHFEGLLDLPEKGVQSILAPESSGVNSAPQWLSFHAITRSNDRRIFDGRVLLLPPTGLSIISDIDDTLKITEAFHRRKMLHNTFLKDFSSVPHMAALYRHWETTHCATFHYVSASPWHLYPFLTEFLKIQNFPYGTFHLRDFRLMPADLRRTLLSSRRIKMRHIQSLLTRFQERRFILVGDSGESDPALYAILARRYPQQIEKIFVRNVTGQSSRHSRWRKAFSAIPAARWQVFDDPREIETAIS